MKVRSRRNSWGGSALFRYLCPPCVSIGIILFVMCQPGSSYGQDCGPDTDCYTKCYDEQDLGGQAECFTKHIDEWPDRTDVCNLSLAYSGRGFAYYGLKRYDKAIADYNKAIEADGKSVRPYFYRGDAYSALAQYDRAVADYSEAIKLGLPGESDVKVNSPAYCARGLAYSGLKEYDKAMADLTSAIDLDPSGKCGTDVRGYAYSIFGGVRYLALQYAKAIEDYDKAIELKPDYSEAYLNRGNIYLALSQYNAAITDFNETIELSSNVGVAYYERGLAYAYLGQYDKAMEDLNKAVDLDPAMPSAYGIRGAIYSVLGRKPEAEAEFLKAESKYSAQISSSPGDSALYDLRGWNYLWAGKCEAARADFEKAIELDKNYSSPYGNLGVYWWHCRNNKERALKWYKKSFEHGFSQWGAIYNAVSDGHFIAGLSDAPDFRALVEKYRAAGVPVLPDRGVPNTLARTSISNILDSLDAMALLLKHPAVDGNISGLVAEKRAKIEQDPKQVMELVEWFYSETGSFVDNEYFNILDLRPKSVDPETRAKEWEAASKEHYAWNAKYMKEVIRVIKGLKVLGAESTGLDLELDILSRWSRNPYTPLGKKQIETLEHNLAHKREPGGR